MKSKILAITVALALVLGMVFAVAGPVAAAPLTWNVAGTWGINFLEGATVVSTYTITLAQTGTAISDTGMSVIPPGYTWTVAGSISGNTVNLTGTYTSGVTGTISLNGTIAADGSMSGNWSQVTTPGGSANGTWVSTSGQATPIFAPITSSGSVQIQGEMVAPTITLTAPGPFDFGQFAEGLNAANSQAGYVQFAPGSDQFATWALSATSTAPYTAGEMYCSALNNFLSTQMAVSLDGSNYAYLSGGVTTAPSTSANSTFYLYAHQNVTQADILVGSGTYSIVVNLMATVTP